MSYYCYTSAYYLETVSIMSVECYYDVSSICYYNVMITAAKQKKTLLHDCYHNVILMLPIYLILYFLFLLPPGLT